MSHYVVFRNEEDEIPVVTNKRKSLVPLFILEILESNSNYRKQFSQEDLIRHLDAYPYSIDGIDRKTVGRNLNLLMKEFPMIRKGSEGVYYDRNAA